MNRQSYQKRPATSSGVPLPSVSDTVKLAAWLVQHAPGHVWLLRGTLGSGKTTLVRAALRSLGFRGAVASPTFTLARHYTLPTRSRWSRAVHIDAYRITGQHEEAALDMLSAANDERCLVLVEWPERLRWRPQAATRVYLQHARDGRNVKITPRLLQQRFRRWSRLQQSSRDR